ncbi:protein phosphatase 1 regulatory subunit 37 [Chironomus tepperi]|uniref:protein phosphatase 1 regulatory subunit 37 n=1 Tax=Chironomus tepperi TaxID=113505 RepID=UPI00391F466F
MEISENVENNKHQRNTGVLHSTQSQPILLDCEENTQENKDKSSQKRSSKRRVSFASSSQLTQFLEPLNPFESFAVPVSSAEELSNVYKRSCDKHKTQPIPAIIEHLESLNFEKLSNDRADVLNLKQTTLTHDSCEALEELFKRVKYRSIDLTSCSLDDISATSLFDMIEYYEACNELNISENTNIKNRGLLACINMIKRSQALHSLSTRGTIISDSNASSLGNALLSSYIYTLKLEHAQLSGRPILCLSGALQKNRVLKELCLANNELTPNDAFHIGNILKNNYHLQLLDISNNDIQNEGFRHLAEALSYQSVHVSKTSSADSLSSSSMNKFDFNDFTANLNNINNNRNRFCPTPPPLQNNNNNKSRNENSSIINVNNNNNSILPVCDSDKSNVATGRSDDAKQQQQKNEEQSNSAKIKIGVEPSISNDGASSTTTTTIAITSTNVNDDAKSSANNSNRKFKYTSESLSPISHGYDDSTGTHTLFSSHSPERSFSSESLCSTESVESNDSKSSIRLIESKFRNGTLERQSYNHYSSSVVQDSAEKKLTGLQVLILWNNNLSSACAPSTSDLFECTEYLQIINFGQNHIGNEFLMNIKSSLKLNESIISLGMQATNITCDGLKTLAEVIEFGGNTTLQRIDLRNNNLSITGLSTLSEALNSNKTITRIDLDDAPKNEMLPVNTEYQRLVNTIRQQCSLNENPPEQQQPSEQKPSSTSTSTNMSRTKKPHFTSRKISLTVIPSGVKIVPKQQLLEPIKKQTINRSPSPILSPSSPLTSPSRSPSRSRFQVSRVSESSSSGIGSKSPSSSSSSPTFFPSPSSSSLNSRFRVVAVTENPKKSDINNQSITPLKVSEQPKSENIMTMTRKEIDISTTPSSSIKPILNIHSIASSQSDDQLDYDEKRFIDLDSCSSFSSSIDSIDRQTDISSTDSFDLVEKTPADINDKTINNNDEVSDDKKDIFSNENTLTVSTSSSSSNEGLTLTTNSPAELSPKQEPHKRTRKTSWIHSAISGSSNKNNSNNNENSSTSSYPATLDKLLNLFHHPSSIFSKTSPDSSLKANNEDQSPSQQLQPPQKSSGMGQKENSISGFLQSLVSLTHNKKEEKSPQESTILQNISPENTIGKNASNSQMALESLPKSIKKELKENISPENTISCENLAGIEKQQRGPSKVVFVVGEDSSLDFSETSFDESSHSTMKTNDPKNDDIVFDSHPHYSLGDIARDSLAIFKSTNDQQDES